VRIKSPNPKLRIIAGPNGSGKSTLLHFLRTQFKFPLGYCLNPDEIEQELKQGRLYLGWQSRINQKALEKFLLDHPLSGPLKKSILSIKNNVLIFESGHQVGYLALIVSDFLRLQWLVAKESFTFETVMSHHSKVDFLQKARRANYRTYLYYVCTESVLINRARIANRVETGGHDVPNEKIEERRERSLSLVPKALKHTSRAYFFDNSSKQQRLIAEFEDARPVQISENLPRWFVESVWNKLPK
jgi:predicted ABC-type ATPase